MLRRRPALRRVRASRRRTATSLGVAVLISALAAGADEPAPTRSSGYSAYEQQTLEREASRRGFELDDAPEGKIIEGVSIATLDVIEDRDPVPRRLNLLHSTTRQQVVARELLLREGEVFRQTLLDETARNLRQLPQLSLVLAVAVRGTTPGRVRLLLITKDVWSLRLVTVYELGPGGLQSLYVAPTETNLFGRHRLLGAQFLLQPLSFAPGVRVFDPWFLDRRLRFAADASVIVNRERGDLEGSYGSASLVKPLFSTRTEWAYGVSANFNRSITRRYINAKLATYNARATPETDRVPFEWRSRTVETLAFLTRSFGWATKLNFTGAVVFSERLYRPTGQEGVDEVAAAEFNRRQIPRSDRRLYPYVEIATYTTSFARLFDAESLGLQEDFRLGHSVTARVYPVTEALGSSRTFLGTFLGAEYTVPLADGFARAVVESVTERERSRLADASVTASLRILSPRFVVGRLVFDANVFNRYENFLNRQSLLGGNGRLRGYPSNFFQGKDVVVSNLELRSRSVSIHTVQLGGVLFYDTGDAFSGFARLSPHSSAGFGARVLIPQLNRITFRGDLGFPIERSGLPPGVSPYSFFFAFEQAFGVPAQSP